MIAAHRRRIEKNDREKIFIISNAADFPEGSPVSLISAEIDAKVAEFLALDAAFVSAFGSNAPAQEIKGDTRDLLISNLCDIVTAAVAVGDEAAPGITAKFKMPHPRTAQNLIATAEAWYAETEPYEDLFVAAGLNADFRAKLLDGKNDFQKAREATNGASEEYLEKVGALDALMCDIMNLVRRRSALIELKYKNNPARLASWSIASHLDRPPRKKINIVMQMI